MYLNNIYFKAIESPLSEKYKRTRTYAQLKPALGKATLHDKGENLTELSLTMYFHASFCNPGNQITKLNEAMAKGEPLPYFWKNGEFKGNFVITSISVNAEKRLSDGTLLSAEIDVELLEYNDVNFLESTKKKYKIPILNIEIDIEPPTLSAIGKIAAKNIDIKALIRR